MNFAESLGLLSTGLDLERVGGNEVKARVELKKAELSSLFALPDDQFTTLLERRENLLLEPGLESALKAVAAAASRQKIGQAKMLEDAWASLKARLESHAPGNEQRPASLAEILCAIKRVGPSEVLGLDLERHSLSDWTRALLAIARETREIREPGALRKIQPWLAVYALRQLGGLSTVRVPVELMLDWAAREPQHQKPQASDELDGLVHTEGLGEGMSNRWAIVVRNSRSSLTQSWIAPPTLGMMLVLEARQFDVDPLLVMMASAFGGAPGIVAWEEPSDGPDIQKRFEAISSKLISPPSVVYLYPPTEGSKKTPAIVDPSGPDVVFRRAIPLAS